MNYFCARYLIFGLIQFSLNLHEGKKLDGYKFPVYSSEYCPKNEKERNERSSAISCTKDKGYLCLPNENITELLEFCLKTPFMWIQEGICLYLDSRNSEFYTHNCTDFLSGCHNTSFPSNELYKYPECTSIGDGCFLSESSCKECANGYYGYNCTESCGRCIDPAECSPVNGSCPTGCMAGYFGRLCKTECKSGNYGLKCNETCGHCTDPLYCSNINGTCLTGCKPGYEGERCQKEQPHRKNKTYLFVILGATFVVVLLLCSVVFICFKKGNLICKRNDGEENHEEDNLSFIDQQNQSGSGALTEEGMGTASTSLSARLIIEYMYTVNSVQSVLHMALNTDTIYVGDGRGTVVNVTLESHKEGNPYQLKGDNKDYQFQHTVNRNRDLIYTYWNGEKCGIGKKTNCRVIKNFIKIKDWKPIGIHFSRHSNDIVVGFTRRSSEGSQGKIIRYNEKGKEKSSMTTDASGQYYFQYPLHITENYNGDVCASDFDKNAVIVVNIENNRHHTYLGPEDSLSKFLGICTARDNNIIVCKSQSVHLLNQNAEFLRYIHTYQSEIERICSVCLDDQNKLHVGQDNTNKVIVYSYMYTPSN